MGGPEPVAAAAGPACARERFTCVIPSLSVFMRGAAGAGTARLIFQTPSHSSLAGAQIATGGEPRVSHRRVGCSLLRATYI